MILSDFNSNRLLLEAGWARTYEFDYPNYRVDPRPHVLVLGYWRNPRTRNELLGGINLHYLDQQQIDQLRQNLPGILQNKGLRARYQHGLRVLPAIFENFYRTYKRGEIRLVTPSTLRFWNPRADARRMAQEKRRQEKRRELAKRLKKRAQAKKKAVEKHQEKPHDHTLDVERIGGATRADWQRKEALKHRYGDGLKLDLDSPADEQELDAERQMADVEAAEIEDEELLHDLDVDEEEVDLRPREDMPPQDDEIVEDYDYHGNIGFIWKSPAAYRKYHSPFQYSTYRPKLGSSIADLRPKPVNAVINLKTGEVIVDGCSHIEMIQEAAWDFDHALRIEYDGGNVVAYHDDDVEADKLLRQFLVSDAGYYFLSLNDHGRDI